MEIEITLEAKAFLNYLTTQQRKEVMERCEEVGIYKLDYELLGKIVRELGL
jgi:hypothetical protein|tara:strand:+ start:599 stop:751 length:153 start_codon:yes stop_codon:yes gene_type:complete